MEDVNQTWVHQAIKKHRNKLRIERCHWAEYWAFEEVEKCISDSIVEEAWFL